MRSKFLQRRENPVRAWVDAVRREEAPANLPLAVDDEERPRRLADGGLIGSVGPGDGALGLEVGKKGEVQLAVLCKREMAPDAVYGYPQDLGVELLELGHDLRV